MFCNSAIELHPRVSADAAWLTAFSCWHMLAMCRPRWILGYSMAVDGCALSAADSVPYLQVNLIRPPSSDPSFNVFPLKCVVVALRRFPSNNVSPAGRLWPLRHDCGGQGDYAERLEDGVYMEGATSPDCRLPPQHAKGLPGRIPATASLGPSSARA